MKIKSQLKKVGRSSHIIPIPEEKALAMLGNFGKRVLCIIEGQSPLHVAILRSNAHGYYIMVGKSTLAKIAVESGAAISVNFDKDTSKYQAEVPEELSEVLLTDPEGSALFEKLTDGKKRSIIHLVSSPKRIETRINRVIKVIENLKMGYTKPRDFLK